MSFNSNTPSLTCDGLCYGSHCIPKLAGYYVPCTTKFWCKDVDPETRQAAAHARGWVSVLIPECGVLTYCPTCAVQVIESADYFVKLRQTLDENLRVLPATPVTDSQAASELKDPAIPPERLVRAFEIVRLLFDTHPSLGLRDVETVMDYFQKQHDGD